MGNKVSLTVFQVTSTSRDRFSRYSKWLDTFRDRPSYVVRVSNRDAPHYYFLPVRPKYLSQRLILKHPQPRSSVVRDTVCSNECDAYALLLSQSDVWDCRIAIDAAHLPTLRQNILPLFRGAQDFPSFPIIQGYS